MCLIKLTKFCEATLPPVWTPCQIFTVNLPFNNISFLVDPGQDTRTIYTRISCILAYFQQKYNLRQTPEYYLGNKNSNLISLLLLKLPKLTENVVHANELVS